MTKISEVDALEILDSRGNPTVRARVLLSDGSIGVGDAPSGASTGTHEALELRDGDPSRYGGKGVRKAVENVRSEIAPALRGRSPQEADDALIALDGTPDKSRLGANAVLAVSCAVAEAAASSQRIPLWRYLAQHRRARLPLPMVNILSGGLHAGRQLEFQDFLAVPHAASTYGEALHTVVAVHRAARQEIEARGYALTGTADEGGWGPRLENNQLALEVLTAAIERAGFRPGEDVSIALDVAATHFYRHGCYELRSESRTLDPQGLVELLADWCARFPVVSIEDGMAEDDWDGWRLLTGRLGSRVRLIGDDLFTTNPARIRRGLGQGAANAVLVKMNQIGTVTETLAVIDLCAEHNLEAVVSARSGETESSFLADLAVASGAGHIKVGSIRGSERLAKYNRLLALEAEDLPYGGAR
ncbi:MAG: phosphopyruvate hydratase [Bryobacteraceae bacterium]|nr:phosphopyruvate hydratase [Bryobacteraceae bacterium]